MPAPVTTDLVWTEIEKRIFVTYGVGVPLLDMRDPKKARGRAPVG